GNNNIDVYKDDKLVENPEDIDWTNITKQNLPYHFKQEPGSSNSLGLIKFLFDNNSSIYLHDTPVKWVFSQKMRAVSHGCIRLGDPKGLAQNLFGDGDRFKTISDDMGQDNPDPTTIYLPKKTPVYITYVTCWADENGKLQFRNDVYGLDIVLYERLQKILQAGKN
ncbi:MAG TPA: L,D-transpeptidase family protein, partial [Mucilaginibacter sp.]|nr:L,D-transpeptidase family protein [Mucilaginibacter sp.]